MMVCLWEGFYTVEEVIDAGNPGNPCICHGHFFHHIDASDQQMVSDIVLQMSTAE